MSRMTLPFVRALHDGEFLENLRLDKKIKRHRQSPRFTAINAVACGLGVFMVLMLVFAMLLGDPATVGRLIPWLLLAPTVLLFCGLVPPIIRMAARDRHRAVAYVAAWGTIGLIVLTATWYAVFFAFVPADSVNFASFERLLNVPPALVAVFGAGLGWYVTYQSSMKTHRTNNSFALVQQTRTSTEYLRCLRAFQTQFPPGVSMDGTSEEFFAVNVMSRLPALEEELDQAVRREQRAEQVLERGTRASTEIRREMRTIEAVLAAKYLLNYYEFMAFAIDSGDLDDELLYETISPTVVSIFKRTRGYRCYMQEKADPRAMEHLESLVERWDDLAERVAAKERLSAQDRQAPSRN